MLHSDVTGAERNGCRGLKTGTDYLNQVMELESGGSMDVMD